MFAHSAPRRPLSVPFSPRAAQNFAPAPDLASITRLALDYDPSTSHAPSSIPNDEYFDFVHVQTAHSLPETSTRVALATGDQDRVVSSSAPAAVHFTGSSTSLGLSAVVPAYTSIPASPLRSDTPTSSIRPFTSFSSVALPSEPQEYVAPNPDNSKTLQTCITTTSARRSYSDSSLAFAPCLVDQERVIPPHIRSTAPSIDPASYLHYAASIYMPTSNLAPPYRSEALPSISQPHTFPRATSPTISPRKHSLQSLGSPTNVSARSPSLSASNASPHFD